MKLPVKGVVLSILMWVMCVAGAAATSDTAMSPRDNLLSRIDEKAIPTGILYDLVVPLSDIETFNGSLDASPIDLVEWRQIYFEIYKASIQEPSRPEAGRLRELANRKAAEGIIPIGLMDVAYNRLTPASLGDIASPQGGAEPIGAGQILERTVFTAAALKPYTYQGANVEFRLEPDFHFTNRTGTMPAISMDFGDGLGFRRVEMGSPCRVSYSGPGVKTIRLVALLDDGTDLHAAFSFDVRQLQVPLPDDTLFVTASLPYLGEYATGEAYIYLGESNVSLTNPVLVIEGFDMDNTMDWEYLYTSMNQEGMIESLHTAGYDAVVLNFTEAVDYIQRNSYLVVELIQQINGMIPPGADLAVIGASMGGLCGRYALTYMEGQGLDHNTRTFISFDSPQKGANIPLGIQYWMMFFSSDSESAAFLLERLSTPAARQMLVYFYTDPPGATGESDPLFGAFYADLDSLGGYPGSPRRVAIANGSGHMIDQGFAPGEQIVLYEYSSLLVDIVGNVWAVPDNSYHIVFDGLMDLIWPLPDRDLVVYVDGTKPYDSAPGGSRASMATMDSTEAPYGDIIALHDSHCFIPTISALDLDTDDLFYDIAGDPDLLAHTPFDTVYYPVANEPHISISAESKTWFLDEITRGAQSGIPSRRPPLAGVLLDEGRPNPFNGRTALRFYVPAATHVEMVIYDIHGRRVARLLDGKASRGWHDVAWDGKDASGRAVSSGVYFCVLETQGARRVTRLVNLR